MNFIETLEDLSNELGGDICANCNTFDIFFGLMDKCPVCETPIDKHDSFSTLLFSSEVLLNFLASIDTMTPPETKRPFLQFLKDFILQLKQEDSINESKLLQIQALLSNIGQIGSESIGGTVTVKQRKPSIQLLNSHTNVENPSERMLSLTAIVLSIQYLIEFPIKNEYTLQSENNNTNKKSSPVADSSKNKGCLLTLIVIATLSITILSILS